MKRFSLTSLLGITLSINVFIACNDDSFTETILFSAPPTRAVQAEASPVFEWENTTNIKLEGLETPVTLPWYSGASTNIPSEILDSYKATDGWRMVYNFCSQSNYTEKGKYYLLFYNIFSGTLRTFYYNPYDVNEATQTFWHFQANRPSKLFSAWGKSSIPNDCVCQLTDFFASNVTRDTVKSISRGWNYFDTDLSGYDPNIATQNITYSISAHCLKQGTISMKSNIQLQSEGAIVQQVKGTSMTNNLIGLVGNTAKLFLDTLISQSGGTRSTNLNINPKKLILKGAKHLVDKLFLKGDDPLNFSVKLNTTGNINSIGDIESNSQSNISPLSRLLISGSKPSSETTFLPSFENMLGVWNLKQTPIIKYVAFQKIIPGEEDGFRDFNPDEGTIGPSLGGGIIDIGGTPDYMSRTQIINMKMASLAPITLDSIEINPDLLPYIDHLEVETDVYDTNWPVFLSTGFNKNDNPAANITIVDMDTRTLLGKKKSALWSNCSVIQSKTKYWNYTPNPQPQFKYTPIAPEDLGRCNFIFMPMVKVSLIIYPKTPDFDGTPITLMRTYSPTFVWDESLAALYDPNQKVNIQP